MERSTSDERCVPVPARLLPPPGGRSRFYAGQDFELAPTSLTVPILRHDNGNEVRACSRFMADSLPSFRWPRRKRVTASTAKLRSARLLLSEDRYSTPRCCYVGKKREGEIGDRETVLLISLSAARDDRHL